MPSHPEIVKLREKGKTYSEIQEILGFKIPKSTLSYWARKARLSSEAVQHLQFSISQKLELARVKSRRALKIIREKYMRDLEDNYRHFQKLIKNRDVSKIALAMLYLGEGGKTRSSVMFGNSDPGTIQLFMKLLRRCYRLDEAKFRCTVQCRADQNTKELEKFWSDCTRIKINQFYKTNIDPRTKGKVSKNNNYKGVCRIDYFSARIDQELKAIVRVIQMGR